MTANRIHDLFISSFRGSQRLVEEYLEGLLLTATDESSVYEKIYKLIYHVDGAFTDTTTSRGLQTIFSSLQVPGLMLQPPVAKRPSGQMR